MRLTHTLARLLVPAQLLALTLTIILTGCSALETYQIADQNDIDQWLKNHQYGRALNALNLEAALFSSANTQKKLKRVKISASQYDRKQAANILKLQSKDKWKEALKLLNTSLRNYPDGKQLHLAKRKIQRQQERLALKLKAQLLLAKTEWLSKSLRIYQSMLHSDPDNQTTKGNISNIQLELKKSADKLQTLGNESLRNNEYDLAEIYLSNANRLQPTKELGESLTLLELRSNKTAQKIKLLSTGMKEALKNGDLLKGRKLITELDKINDYPFELEKLKKSIINNIKTEVTKILKAGDILYTNGKIKEAKTEWGKALKLEPENDKIHDRISRAERALETLHELKKPKSK